MLLHKYVKNYTSTSYNIYILLMQENDQPIHIAAYHGYCDIVRTLVEDYGIDPSAKAYVC